MSAKTQEMFSRGWKYGNDYGEASAAEAIEECEYRGWPTDGSSIDAFCQGSVDGAKGDCWRLHAFHVEEFGSRPSCCNDRTGETPAGPNDPAPADGGATT